MILNKKRVKEELIREWNTYYYAKVKSQSGFWRVYDKLETITKLTCNILNLNKKQKRTIEKEFILWQNKNKKWISIKN